MESLEILNKRAKTLVETKGIVKDVYIGLPDDNLSKTKDELVSEVEAEESKYIKNFKDMKASREEAVAGAKKLLSPQVESISQPVLAAAAAVGTAEMFKPQGNLQPNYLDKSASHLEVKSFCSSLDTYINTGFRGTPTKKV